MTDLKEIAPAELSLKYMAWNIKSIDENLKKIAILLEELIESNKSLNNQASTTQIKDKYGSVPF